jgi:hypothetical protein
MQSKRMQARRLRLAAGVGIVLAAVLAVRR